MPGRVVAHVASAQLIAGIEKAGSRGCAHRFYRSHAAARPHAPFLSGAAVSIDQMQPKCNQNAKIWGPNQRCGVLSNNIRVNLRGQTPDRLHLWERDITTRVSDYRVFFELTQLRENGGSSGLRPMAMRVR